ncbi:hypothetical protein [Streptomyces sp. NBC_00878]|uniref:hypothetical protein n=1 Tax=Streptomyces sp. NBC_00878 TaxID=2975854 RepID=UPI002253142A|nr:hypothetical protein [Streptomyces sp. NBC_00878]MCX4904649.1 hypothetical protein [Streptomyces sp. NBC_00878]
MPRTAHRAARGPDAGGAGTAQPRAIGDDAVFDLHSANLANIHTTLAHNLKLYAETLPIARDVIDGRLQARHREMVILCSGWNCAAAHQWSHHRYVTAAVGLTEAETDLLSRPPSEVPWAIQKRVLLETVDELHDRSTVGDRTWSGRAEHYLEAELIEVVTLTALRT